MSTIHATASNLLLRITDANNWRLHVGRPEGTPCLYAAGGILNDDSGVEAPVTQSPSGELASYATCFPGEDFGQQLAAFAEEVKAAGW